MGSLPSVSLIIALGRLGVVVQVFGAVYVDAVDVFLSMNPRPPRTVWTTAAIVEVVTCKRENGNPSIETRDDAIVCHFESCCSKHLAAMALVTASLYPDARCVCWTSNQREGVAVLSRMLRNLWSDKTVKSCLQSQFCDLL